MGTRKLGRDVKHRRATLRSLAVSLFLNGRIETTLPKAKEVQPFAEKLITLAREGDSHSRRLARRRLDHKEAVTRLFEDIGPRFVERSGGYTRILKLAPRRGDSAPMAMLELVE